jgi:hypothetical protein
LAYIRPHRHDNTSKGASKPHAMSAGPGVASNTSECT